jgi:hypothetical protein
MSNIVTLKPATGSKKFFSTAKTFMDVENPETGEVEKRERGDYKGERLPRSKQLIRPVWGQNARRWEVNIPDIASEEGKEELNRYVKAFRLKHNRGPMQGQFITEADIFDSSDAFFNHPLLTMTSIEGVTQFDLDNPKDKFFYLCKMKEHDTSVPTDNNPLRSARVRHVLTDPTIEKKERRNKAAIKKDAYILLGQLTAAKQKQVAIAMNLIIGKDSEPEDVEVALIDAIEDTTSKLDNTGLTKAELFKSLCESPSDELQVKYLIGSALKSGVIRDTKTGFIVYGNKVAKDRTELEAYLKNEENGDIYSRIEKDINERLK